MDDKKINWYFCKSCNRKFGCILKHLAQSIECKDAYSDKEISELRKESKEITRKNDYIQRRYFSQYYQYVLEHCFSNSSRVFKRLGKKIGIPENKPLIAGCR